jgi:uncharacterized protein (TIGR02147 family)
MSAKQLGEFLKEELVRRQTRNPRYSLRAFARALEISPSQLSQMLNGKRAITAKTLHRVCESLCMSPLERKDMFERFTLSEAEAHPEATTLMEDEFQFISEWYHFAILSLSELPSAKSDPAWIAKRLNIPAATAREALGRLRRLGILTEGPELKQARKALRVSAERPSIAIRKYHHQILDLANERLESVPMDRRDFSALTIAINPENLSKAKAMIEKFQDDLAAFLRRGPKIAVYQLACQLFPVAEED